MTISKISLGYISGIVRYFSKKLRKNDKKIPDDVDAGEKDTYLWEKGK